MYILSNIAQLYDGCSSGKTSLHKRVDLIVEEGRITSLEPHQPDREIAEQIGVIDCSQYTVTPGLIDCHSHITILGADESALDDMNGPTGLLTVERILYTTLVHGGVTTARDVGGATHLMKRLVDEGTIIGPRLKIAICMLSTTGGHADFRGPDRCHAGISKLFPPGPGRPDSIVDGPWECRKRVREIAACGADLIKICASPGVLSPGDKLEHQEFSAEEITAICDEARARGLRVAAHAHSQTGIRMAIENGVSDIQHISFMSEREVEMAHAANCTVTPTSWIGLELAKGDDYSPLIQEKIDKMSEHHANAVSFARTGGLKILMGTDPVLRGMHGRNYLELDALIKEGLFPLEAWYGSTGLAASEVGQEDTGTIKVGQRADLLVCKGDVIEHPDRIGDGLVEVIKDGVTHRGAFPDLPRAEWGERARAHVH